MSAFKSKQRHLEIQGRVFHFVSYEGRPADARRNQAGEPDMWYLMVEGRRCPVVVCDSAQTDVEIDQLLLQWALENAVRPAVATRAEAGPARFVPKRRLRE
jgi:hypothetical protein